MLQDKKNEINKVLINFVLEGECEIPHNYGVKITPLTKADANPDTQADGHTERQTERQTDRQTNR